MKNKRPPQVRGAHQPLTGVYTQRALYVHKNFLETKPSLGRASESDRRGYTFSMQVPGRPSMPCS